MTAKNSGANEKGAGSEKGHYHSQGVMEGVTQTVRCEQGRRAAREGTQCHLGGQHVRHRANKCKGPGAGRACRFQRTRQGCVLGQKT